MNCNATLTLYRLDDATPLHEMKCWRPAEHDGDFHKCGGLTWVDTLPGAKPHEPPRYYVRRQYGDYWWVCDGEAVAAGEHPASFFGPNAEAFAREHADRLNREVTP